MLEKLTTMRSKFAGEGIRRLSVLLVQCILWGIVLAGRPSPIEVVLIVVLFASFAYEIFDIFKSAGRP